MRLGKYCRATFVVFFTLLMSGASIEAAGAATIWSTRLDGGLTAIFVSGDFAYGDERRFVDTAIAADSAVVVFQSPGGNLFAGIEIGKAIRLKGFSSLVLDDQVCASACAIAWLGGRVRMMGASAKIGFHAAYEDNSGQKIPTGVGNALVGAYLSQLGLPDAAIIYVTSASPYEVQWLTLADAFRYNIDVRPFNVPKQKEVNAPEYDRSKAAPSSQETLTGSASWAGSDDWIQIFSRQELADAIQIAQQYRGTFSNARVFKHASGLYVVAIGPFSNGTGRAERDRLLTSGRIPADSLVTKGYRFVELEFNDDTLTRTSASRSDLEARAVAFFEDFHRKWSLDNATALSNLDNIYDDTIEYYGVSKIKSFVMDEKRVFADRWPERFYSVRANSASASCSSETRECTVSGLIDWKAISAGHKFTSTGTARYELTLRLNAGRTLVMGESGTILNRVKVKN